MAAAPDRGGGGRDFKRCCCWWVMQGELGFFSGNDATWNMRSGMYGVFFLVFFIEEGTKYLELSVRIRAFQTTSASGSFF